MNQGDCVVVQREEKMSGKSAGSAGSLLSHSHSARYRPAGTVGQLQIRCLLLRPRLRLAQAITNSVGHLRLSVGLAPLQSRDGAFSPVMGDGSGVGGGVVPISVLMPFPPLVAASSGYEPTRRGGEGTALWQQFDERAAAEDPKEVEGSPGTS
jgi:hypothetical protein